MFPLCSNALPSQLPVAALLATPSCGLSPFGRVETIAWRLFFQPPDIGILMRPIAVTFPRFGEHGLIETTG